MTEIALKYFQYKPSSPWPSSKQPSSPVPADEPSTCTEAEPFALRVLDNSMEPEFRRGCIILIDPTGRATHGSYVLVEGSSDMLFRQLTKNDDGWVLTALNDDYPVSTEVADDLGNVVGVIVQRAGIRRSYHKRYE